LSLHSFDSLPSFAEAFYFDIISLVYFAFLPELMGHTQEALAKANAKELSLCVIF
jgi:hypothetical protein